MIPLAEWARRNGKDPSLARQKLGRKTLQGVEKIGNILMIEETTPWVDMRSHKRGKKPNKRRI